MGKDKLINKDRYDSLVEKETQLNRAIKIFEDFNSWAMIQSNTSLGFEEIHQQVKQFLRDNKPFKVSYNSLCGIYSQIDHSSLKKVEVKWSEVEFGEDTYNEEYLAHLRNDLKELERTRSLVVIVPVIDKPLNDTFITAFTHVARRIKDCTNVAGFLLPGELAAEGFEKGTLAGDFMDTLQVKHPQYVYFMSAAMDDQDKIPDNIVLL